MSKVEVDKVFLLTHLGVVFRPHVDAEGVEVVIGVCVGLTFRDTLEFGMCLSFEA